MAGIRQIINGRLAQSKSKGKAFVQEMAHALSPQNIAKEMVSKKKKS